MMLSETWHDITYIPVKDGVMPCDGCMMTSSNGNIFRVTGHLSGEFIRSQVNSPQKGQWRGALMFSLICTRINGWVNNGEAGDLRRHRTHYDAIVMYLSVLVIRSVWSVTECKDICHMTAGPLNYETARLDDSSGCNNFLLKTSIILTHCPLKNTVVILKVKSENTYYGLSLWVILVKLLTAECHKTLFFMIRQRWVG